MLVMGTNKWEDDIPKEPLVEQALEFAESLRSQGVAELIEAWIAHDMKLMWCTWETEDLKSLKAAFADITISLASCQK